MYTLDPWRDESDRRVQDPSAKVLHYFGMLVPPKVVPKLRFLGLCDIDITSLRLDFPFAANGRIRRDLRRDLKRIFL